MATTFDKTILDIEREINDLKTGRVKIMDSTTTITKTIQCNTTSIMQDSISDTRISKIIITPDQDGMANGFVFTISQNGIDASTHASFFAELLLGDNDEYIAEIHLLNSSDAWNYGESKTYTHSVNIIASSDFSYQVVEEAV